MITYLIKLMKKYFFSGILAFLPIGVTCYAIVFVTKKINDCFSSIVPYPIDIYVDTSGWGYKILVVVIVFSFFCFLGILVRLYIGRKLLEIGDFFMKKIPFFNNFYNLIKKITTMVLDEKSQFFKSVVLIEFPIKESYSIAFLTNSSKSCFVESDNHYVHVFLPTAPNPTTGFFLIVDQDRIQKLDLSVEEAVKLIISGGALVSK